MEQLARTTIAFTAAERTEIKRRQREAQRLIAQLAVTETLEEQEQLAEELCPQFDDWIRGRNRIMSAPPRVVAMIAPRTRNREHRSAGTRRTSSSSSTAAQDPGDPDGEPEPLRLAPRAVLTFGCLSAEARGAEVEETGR